MTVLGGALRRVTRAQVGVMVEDVERELRRT